MLAQEKLTKSSIKRATDGGRGVWVPPVAVKPNVTRPCLVSEEGNE